MLFSFKEDEVSKILIHSHQYTVFSNSPFQDLTVA